MSTQTHEGGCHCGAVRYVARGAPLRHSLCHCTDCRRHAGAPLVAWAKFPAEAVTVTRGQLAVYHSSADGQRHFCAACGTGLLYTNEVVLPGMIDIQSATLDDPNALPVEAHVQVAERIGWMAQAHELPMDERYPLD